MKQINKTHSRAFANLAATQTLDIVQGITPQWLRLPAAMRVSGFSRNMLLRHLDDGSLLAKHYMQEGKEKGVWFVNFDSLMALMDGLPDGRPFAHPKKKGEMVLEGAK
jgi:hypothetical protein